MDTVEELGNTYYYSNMMNLPANELFYWIMLDVTVEHFTSSDVAVDVLAAAAVYSGRNNMTVSGKLANATPGTSRASLTARRHLKGYRLPIRLPTLIGDITRPHKIKTIMTDRLATFVGRTIPVVGWIILAVDVSRIAGKAVSRYNTIARKEDRIW
ncbi:STM2901 family protein [Yersinia pekkanenii]|uniref:Phage membrane protein n=1 Tax=Yersinia pekkanenii TaxID=1288385 RepID=A0A0T9RAU7_9GAMM|nr:hypothetical protein [Yersinia pekkanenii]CNI53107.1 putative phage membrane protein [Yersinia pekkanenii]CRY69300.1 putative phage membrane protein [Yersinia pekkanenii]